MAERKRIGPGGTDYIGIAHNLLAQLKQVMALNKLMVLRRDIDLAGGVRISVSSVFGQDTISIQAPPELKAVIDAQVVTAERQQERPFNGEPAPRYEVGEVKHYDNVGTVSTASVMFTAPSTTPTAPVPGAYRIIIGGRAADPSRPAIWSSDGVYGQLGLRNNERNGAISAISPDGKWFIGSVEIYDSGINPATINPFGGGGTAYGWIQRAYVWKSGIGNDGNMIGWKSGDPGSAALNMEGNKIVGTTSLGKFEWDTSYRGTLKQVSGAAPTSMVGALSKDGRVRTDGNKYQVDGGPWKEWGPKGAVAYVVHTIQEPSTPGAPTGTVSHAVTFN